MTRRGIVVATALVGIALLAFAAVLATVGVWGEPSQTPPAAVAPTPVGLPFAAIPLDDDSAWTTPDYGSGGARLVIRQFGTELGYVRMGTSTSVCAEVIDTRGAPVRDASVAFIAHGPAAIEPQDVLTNDVGSACATLTPHVGGSLHVQAIATKEGYETASAGKVSEVVDAPEAAAESAGTGLALPGAFAGGAGVVLLAEAALMARTGGGLKARR